MLSDRAKFLIHAAEVYKDAKGLTGAQLHELFDKYGVWEYIYEYYGALHLTGDAYNNGDIDEFIERRRVHD